VECGVEIEFADENEFAKLVSEHACVRYWCQWLPL
jgi:hypothetical protein